MPTPIVTTITPSTGLAFGRELVEILGQNFREPPAIPANVIPVPVAEPTVEVLFDGVLAETLEVVNGGRILVLTPPGRETADVSGDAAPITVTVTNLDDNGDPIPGETGTNATGFTYRLPEMYSMTTLQFVVNKFIQDLKDQVHPNVMLTVHTDWDGTLDGLNIANIASFPAIVLDGPEVRQNRFYSRNALTEVELEDGSEEFAIKREPRTVNLGFDILLLSDNVQEILNLAQHMTQYFHRNKYFRLPNDLANPDPNDWTEYELDYQPGGDFSWATEPNNGNIRQMRGACLIRGIDIAEGPIVGKGAALGAKQGDPDVILESAVQLPDTDGDGNAVDLPVSGAPLNSPPPR